MISRSDFWHSALAVKKIDAKNPCKQRLGLGREIYLKNELLSPDPDFVHRQLSTVSESALTKYYNQPRNLPHFIQTTKTFEFPPPLCHSLVWEHQQKIMKKSRHHKVNKKTKTEKGHLDAINPSSWWLDQSISKSMLVNLDPESQIFRMKETTT